jgi:hypothetical protein
MGLVDVKCHFVGVTWTREREIIPFKWRKLAKNIYDFHVPPLRAADLSQGSESNPGTNPSNKTTPFLHSVRIRLSKFNAYNAITQSPRLFRPIVLHPSIHPS